MRIPQGQKEMRYNKDVQNIFISPLINKALLNKGRVIKEMGYNINVSNLYLNFINAE